MPRPSDEVERDRAAAATEMDDPFEGRREWRESGGGGVNVLAWHNACMSGVLCATCSLTASRKS